MGEPSGFLDGQSAAAAMPLLHCAYGQWPLRLHAKPIGFTVANCADSSPLGSGAEERRSSQLAIILLAHWNANGMRTSERAHQDWPPLFRLNKAQAAAAAAPSLRAPSCELQTLGLAARSSQLLQQAPVLATGAQQQTRRRKRRRLVEEAAAKAATNGK